MSEEVLPLIQAFNQTLERLEKSFKLLWRWYISRVLSDAAE